MPGWHEKTASHRESGRLRTLGIIQEQHPDRTSLFMQWKQMDWPILVDSLNLLQVEAVPLTFLVDEHGVIRYARPNDEELERFLEASYDAPSSPSTRAAPAPGSAEALFLSGSVEALDEAVAIFEERVRRDPDDGWSAFRLGVALRKRYDSDRRRSGDFRRAVAAWTAALALDPNQYIWRRRIQQYGPRLDKPYPFYDWVPEARDALLARGETPRPLAVEPKGAEFAAPAKSFAPDAESAEAPDPGGRVRRDEGPLILAETVVVPDVVKPGSAARVHIVMRPDESKKAHWNNEVDDLVFWVEPPNRFQVDRKLHRVRVPRVAVSQETRTVELELAVPVDFRGTVNVPAYALYYVCEDVDGTCLFRRLDLDFELRSE